MPLEIAKRCCSLWSDVKGVVVDPFLGSGTTGVACAKLGRTFIGIELDERYFQIACKRIQKAYDQPDLFVEPPKKSTQEELL
jgi:DNA modification methylase